MDESKWISTSDWPPSHAEYVDGEDIFPPDLILACDIFCGKMRMGIGVSYDSYDDVIPVYCSDGPPFGTESECFWMPIPEEMWKEFSDFNEIRNPQFSIDSWKELPDPPEAFNEYHFGDNLQ